MRGVSVGLGIAPPLFRLLGAPVASDKPAVPVCPRFSSRRWLVTLRRGGAASDPLGGVAGAGRGVGGALADV